MATSYNDYLHILAELWINFEDDERLTSLFEFNNLGFPLAYAQANNLAVITDEGARYVTQTWQSVLDGFELEDIGFDSFDDFVVAAELE
jgi:hypothetical protein